MPSCSQPPDKPYDLATILPLFSDKEFACFFARTIVAANGGNFDSVKCVESFFRPTYDELDELGIHESQWGSMQRCTDAGNLLLVTAKKACPEAFEKGKTKA